MTHNPFSQTRFATCAGQLRQCPGDDGAEVVFAGRSNVGKSSAINAICAQKNLARTSKTPGRTQTINFFEVAPNRRIVDLPGYGYARVNRATRELWSEMIPEYLATRKSLRAAVVVMDARRPLTDYDIEALAWMQRLPLHILLAKSDKLQRAAARRTLQEVLQKIGADGATAQNFSAAKQQGLDEVRGILASQLGL